MGFLYCIFEVYHSKFCLHSWNPTYCIFNQQGWGQWKVFGVEVRLSLSHRVQTRTDGLRWNFIVLWILGILQCEISFLFARLSSYPQPGVLLTAPLACFCSLSVCVWRNLHISNVNDVSTCINTLSGILCISSVCPHTIYPLSFVLLLSCIFFTWGGRYFTIYI